MLDDKLRSELEQGEALLVETCPSLWWGLYSKLVLKGFNETQALELVKTYIITTYQIK